MLSACACTPALTYTRFKPYQAASPLKDTHLHGVTRDPLLTEGAGSFVSPSTRPDQDGNCIVTLSMSGGGVNSAAFAWGALQELNDRRVGPGGRSVLAEIDYIGTASGGGIAGLMLLEVLREHRMRESGRPLSQADARVYFDSARFRGVLDAKLITKGDLAGSILGGAASTKLLRVLDIAVNGEKGIPNCVNEYAGPLAAVPRKSPIENKQYVHCQLAEPLTFGEVFVVSGKATLPAFFPTVTLYESGENLPATGAWLTRLGIEKVLFAQPNARCGDVVPLAQMKVFHGVALSMGFPGIGPVLARTKDGFGVTLADGGQSDNLGLWVAFNATREELRTNSSQTAVHIVLDSALEPQTLFIEAEVGLFSGIELAIFNGVPLLRASRIAEAENLRLRAAEDPGAPRYQRVFVRAGDVLETPAMLYRPFNDLKALASDCYSGGAPTDGVTCLAHATSCAVDCSPRARFADLTSSLANGRRTSEDLIQLGREAMARVFDSEVAPALNKCLGPAGSGN